jgi:prephenate dehydratase
LFPGLEIFQERIQNAESELLYDKARQLDSHFLTDNHTRFLIIRLNDETRLEKVEKEKSNEDEKLAALVRLSFPPESNLTNLLRALSLPVRKIDRRACIPSRHFEDVYVAEILENRKGRTDEEWTSEVEGALARVRVSGGQGTLLGTYRFRA